MRKLPDLRSLSSGNVHGLKKMVNGEIRICVFDKQEIGKTKDSQFTEQEIKVIDERYWPFAVKVEGIKINGKIKKFVSYGSTDW